MAEIVQPTDNDMIDLSVLKESGQKALVDALNSVNGAKTLVLDPTIAGPLGLLTEVSLLKQHGVEKMFWLESGPVKATTTNVVYLCRPRIKWVKLVANQVKALTRDRRTYTHTLILVPRASTLVSRILEEEGVLGDVNISTFALEFIPLEDDVISMENEHAFKEMWADGDETVVYDSAQALMTFQKLFGLFPRIVGKGDCSGRLAGLLDRLVKHGNTGDLETLMVPSEKIDSLIILDRRVDMITPMLTQLTYEGLIDEVVGINNAHVELPSSYFTPSNPQESAPTTFAAPSNVLEEKRRKYRLSSTTDPLFRDLRDLNFASVGKSLNQTARRLDEDYKSRLQAKTVAQLRDFVGKLGNLQTEHQSLKIHTNLSELLVSKTKLEKFNKTLEVQQNLLTSYDVSAQVSAIEDLIAQGADLHTVLRLLCLASLTAGGVKTKALESIKREILQTYGYDYLPLLIALSSPPLWLLLPNPLPTSLAATVPKFQYNSLRKSFRLLADDYEEGAAPDDISYVYSVYAPLSVRLVQCVAQKGGLLSNPATEGETAKTNLGRVRAHPIVGWKGFEEAVASLPGEVIDITQHGRVDEMQLTATNNLPREKSTTTVVFFLGGCTYTEIAALRWVGRQSQGRRFLIATTGIISGTSLMESLSGKGKGKTDTTTGTNSATL